MGTEDDPSVVSEDTLGVVAERKSWYQQGRTVTVIGLLVASVIAALVLTNGLRGRSTTEASLATERPSQTIKQYLEENRITSVPIRPGDAEAPVITTRLPKGWSDIAEDTPDWAYGAAQYEKSTADRNDPATVVFLLSKLTGDVDPARILEYAPAELNNLPNYEPMAAANSSKLSGFDAIQLAGRYTRDDKKRTIAQKTVVIPAEDAVYILQINADAPDSESVVLMRATQAIDEQTTITP